METNLMRTARTLSLVGAASLVLLGAIGVTGSPASAQAVDPVPGVGPDVTSAPASAPPSAGVDPAPMSAAPTTAPPTTGAPAAATPTTTAPATTATTTAPATT